MRKGSTLEETKRILSSFAFHDDILELNFKSSKRKILSEKTYGKCLECFNETCN